MSEVEDDGQEMPVWVRRLLNQVMFGMMFMVLALAAVFLVKSQLDDSDAKAHKMVECEVYNRSC